MSDIEYFPIKEIVTTWQSVDFNIYPRSYPLERVPEKWQELLEEKRKDMWYSRVVNSIKKYGLVGVLVALDNGERLIHLDGHHRLAAMIDLGFTHAPYLISRKELWSKNRLWFEDVGTGFHEDIITRVSTRT